MNRRLLIGIRDELCCGTKQRGEVLRLRRRNPRAQLRGSERAIDFRKQQLGHDEVKLTAEPATDQFGRRPGARQQRRNEYVRVEDDAHSLRGTRFVLRLDGETERLVLR